MICVNRFPGKDNKERQTWAHVCLSFIFTWKKGVRDLSIKVTVANAKFVRAKIRGYKKWQLRRG